MLTSDFEICTRVSDLDSQQHINNSHYLNYSREGFYNILAGYGFSLDFLLKNKISTFSEKTRVWFYKQQGHHQKLNVRTSATRIAENRVFLSQEIRTGDNVNARFDSNLRIDSPEIMSIFPYAPGAGEKLEVSIFSASPSKAKFAMYNHTVKHIDLNVFNECSEAVLWRLNEEARWDFFSQAGLSFEGLFSQDMSLFWIEGGYETYENLHLYDPVEIRTWIDSMDRVRVNICHEVFSGTKKICFAAGQFITVSLSKSRPIRISESIREAFLPYSENYADTNI